MSGRIAVLLVGVLGCGVDRMDLDDADDDADAEAGPVDEVADHTPHEIDGRMYLTRRDGGLIPLLHRDEIGLPADAVHVTAMPYTVPPASWDLSAYQTPVKDQLDRGSCASFATVGAIEAAYKRAWGLTLDLSEQYMFHIVKSTGVTAPSPVHYENQSSYWSGAGWPQTQYLLPTEALAPYAGYNTCETPGACTPLNSIPGSAALLAWTPDDSANPVTQQQVDSFEYSPLHIPPAARANARYGAASVTSYDVATSRSTSFLESLIASNKEVVLSVSLWWKQLPSGIFDYDPTASWGDHVFLLIGYNRAAGYFLVKNSWGGTAPSAYLRVSYNFIANASYGAATINSVVSPYGAPQAKARWIGAWNQDHEGWSGKLVVRRFTNANNTPTRLGTYYAGGSYQSGHSANGSSIDGDRGIDYYVASETENAPGTLTGQQFDADSFDGEPVTSAAGQTSWGPGTEGGVRLSRNPLTMVFSNTFSTPEWDGSWDLDANGSHGTLTITGIIPSTGDYTVNASYYAGGAYHPVAGTVEGARPALMHLAIDGVPYRLHYHGWEDRVISGFMGSGATRSGVSGIRTAP